MADFGAPGLTAPDFGAADFAFAAGAPDSFGVTEDAADDAAEPDAEDEAAELDLAAALPTAAAAFTPLAAKGFLASATSKAFLIIGSDGIF